MFEVICVQVTTNLRMLSDSTIKEITKEQEERLGQSTESSLETRLLDPAFIRQLWENLHDIERKAARLFIVETTHGFFSKRRWDAVAQKSHAHVTLGLTNLRRLGLVFTVRKLWSEVGYCMPVEVREIISSLLKPKRTAEPLPLERTQTLTYYMTGGRGIHLDFIGFLRYVNDLEIVLTQKQAIPRKHVQKLQPVLSFGDEHLSGWYEQLFPSDVRAAYPAAVATILDLALRLQLVQMIDRKLRLQEENVIRWVSKQNQDRLHDLYHILHLHYLPDEAWMQAFAFEMKSTVDTHWHSVHSLVAMVTDMGYAVPADAEEKLLDHWLHPLLGFGLIQLGRDTDDRLYWRWHPFAVDGDASQSHWYIEPTGTIIVSPAVPLSALWELGRLAHLQFEGEMLQCKLSAEKVQVYIASGGTEEQIHDLLQTCCPYPVPEQVGDQIRKWANGARQILFERVIRVHTANPAILDELRSIPMLSSYLTAVISETDFLINPALEQPLVEALRQCGYEPQAGKIERLPQVDRPDSSDMPGGTGLFTKSADWEGYQVENVFPDRYDSLPQLALIPKMWTQHYQSYHPQTLRDLIKRAQEIQVEIQLETRTGEERKGLPQKLDVEMGYWFVTIEVDKKKHKINLEHISRAKIILPSYV